MQRLTGFLLAHLQVRVGKLTKENVVESRQNVIGLFVGELVGFVGEFVGELI